MPDLAGAGNDDRLRRMRQNIFEENLRPARRVDVLGPVRQRLAVGRLKQAAPAERQVDQRRDLLFLRQGQDPLGAAIVECIIDLDRVELLAPQHRLELLILAIKGCGDAQRSNPPLGLQVARRGELIVGIAQVVHLKQVDPVSAQLLE